ncbi:hypothetical protein, partial [Salmonella enterica]|uniref:hypothetical protein n=1 Tax=Salmonella enterica TaxID=28901 RepID=UPI001E3E67B9
AGLDKMAERNSGLFAISLPLYILQDPTRQINTHSHVFMRWNSCYLSSYPSMYNPLIIKNYNKAKNKKN